MPISRVVLEKIVYKQYLIKILIKLKKLCRWMILFLSIFATADSLSALYGATFLINIFCSFVKNMSLIGDIFLKISTSRSVLHSCLSNFSLSAQLYLA